MQSKTQTVEAVVFFSDHGIDKEMLYPEFEAVLDGVVAIGQYAGRQLRAAYVSINPRLLIRSAVFFLLDFDEKGFADRGWNIPLRQLAERAGRGPELGAGPIRLACRSQCPVSWQQINLWDPLDNDLGLLRDAILRNNLGLLVETDVRSGTPVERFPLAEEHWFPADAGGPPIGQPAGRPEHVPRQDTESLLEQQRLELEQRYREQIARLEQDASEREEHWRQQVVAIRKALREQRELNTALQRRLVEQAEKHRQAREEMSEQLRAAEGQVEEEREALRNQLAAEQQARVAAELAQLEEQLAVRDVELDYRNELDAQLQEEIEQLRQERDRLAAQGAEAALQRLAELGMVFVVYHPGAGHLTVALQDLERYQANPTAYAASRCFVGEAHYRAWLAHYQRPSCPVQLPGGATCGEALPRIEAPREFVPGRSDCCARHRVDTQLRTTG
jgi:hypothetical protein